MKFGLVYRFYIYVRYELYTLIGDITMNAVGFNLFSPKASVQKDNNVSAPKPAPSVETAGSVASSAPAPTGCSFSVVA